MTDRPFEERIKETIDVSEEADDVLRVEDASRGGFWARNVFTTDGRIVSITVEDITDLVEA